MSNPANPNPETLAALAENGNSSVGIARTALQALATPDRMSAGERRTAAEAGLRALESMPPRWNWQERARRAEALAERLAASLNALRAIDAWTANRVPNGWPEALRALDRWTAHRADLDTLEQQ